MLIQYAATKHTRHVAESIGRRLVKSGVARELSIMEAAIMTNPQAVIEATRELISASDASELVNMSLRTGKPKRQYKRRDMRAED